MTEFELGVMAGWVAGVVTAGAIAGALNWWSDRNRVVRPHVGYQPCEPVAQDDAFGVDDVVLKKAPAGKMECCACDGTGVRPFFPGNGYKGPNRIPCGQCKGTGWMAQPPKKP